MGLNPGSTESLLQGRQERMGDNADANGICAPGRVKSVRKGVAITKRNKGYL